MTNEVVRGRVCIPCMVAQEGIDYLKNHGLEPVILKDAAEFPEAVGECEAVLLRNVPMTREILKAGRRLKVVAVHGAGYNHVDTESAAEFGIWVTNTPDVTTASVAEFTIGAMIALAKKSFMLSSRLRAGDFYYKLAHKGTQLKGKTLAVIGYGRIGSEVARKAHLGLDMNILAYSPHISSRELPSYVTAVDLEQAFRQADFISLHMPLTEESENLIGRRELEWMKPDACLINCARGKVVIEEDLTAVLREGRIGGAFVDVFEKEPPAPDHPLFSMENVIVTPHMASNTQECMANMAVMAAAQIVRTLSGKQPDYPVNQPNIKQDAKGER